MASRRSPAEIALSAGVLVLGLATAAATLMLPGEGGYAKIGPNFMPGVVAAGLVACGLWLLYEVVGGGWRARPSDDPAERGDHAFHAPGFFWVSAGLGAHLVLIGLAGFVVAGACLFAGVARGFGSARVARDFALGAVISLAVFLFFVRFLNVNLPAGWLAPLLGGAGI
ncbi:MAG: tripartite tricarboxylate transporter TctB family protein [Betaproteobacteria bacterium]|nr:MAG: tripartite tricarboxylate transporter TctB family protein [Betaproteobacteria bacterium]